MKNTIFTFREIRMEVSFNSLDDLRLILSFYQKNYIDKVNIPCKSHLNKDFLLSAIQMSREEFSHIDIIPHFSIQHQFRFGRDNTLKDLITFLKTVRNYGCNEVLLVSGSRKKASLDSVSTLMHLNSNKEILGDICSLGIAFNPYLPEVLFLDELFRLKLKLATGLVNSIWIQFGTDLRCLEKNITLLGSIISEYKSNSNIRIYGSVLIPSKQFISRFKFRPWKGVYCSNEFLESVDFADNIISKILLVYKKYNILPIVETNTSTKNELSKLKNILNIKY